MKTLVSIEFINQLIIDCAFNGTAFIYSHTQSYVPFNSRLERALTANGFIFSKPERNYQVFIPSEAK